MHEESLRCLHALTHFAANAAAAQESLTWLQSHPAARNVLMAVSLATLPAYTTVDIISAHMGPHTQGGLLPRLSLDEHDVDSSPLQQFIPVLPTYTKPSKSSSTLAEERVDFCSKFVLPLIWKNYPNLSAIVLMCFQGVSCALVAVKVSNGYW
jgi:hypothetical protein